MKQTLSCIICVSIFAICLCSCSETVKLGQGNGMVLNGIHINSEYTETIQNSRYDAEVYINVADLLVNLGYSWEEQGNGTILVYKNDDEFVFDLNNKILSRISNDGVLIEPKQDTPVDFILKNGTVVVGKSELEAIADVIETKFSVAWFENDKKVYISVKLSESEQKDYNAVIDGKKINLSGVYKLHSKTDESDFVRVVPLFEIFKECGIEIKSIRGTKVKLKANSKTYTLDTSDGTITQFGRQRSNLDLSGNSEFIFMELEGDEFYCSTPVARIILEYIYNIKLYDIDSGIYLLLQH